MNRVSTNLVSANVRAFVLCVFAFTLILPIDAQEDLEYVRFIEGADEWEGELQTAIVTLVNDRGIELDLVAAVHLGEEEYYASLNDYFTTRDVVLYELVAEPNQIPVRDGAGSTSFIGFIQQTMADFLQVGFQLNEIDYAPFNFLHADLTPSQLEALMESKDESFLSMFFDLAMSQSNIQASNSDGPMSSFNMISMLRAMNSDNQRAAFKYLFAVELGRSGGVMAGEEFEQQFTLLGDRNEAALRVLRQTLQNPDRQRISIFYGAAHMPGLERAATRELGFSRTNLRWLPAWVVP